MSITAHSRAWFQIHAHSRCGRRSGPACVDVGLSMAVLPGVALVVGGTPDGMRTGIAVGALSALLPVMAWVLPAGEPVLPWPDLRHGLLLVALSMACTLLPHALALVALRHLSAFETTLAVNMEPVYAIVLGFYFGVALIMGVVSSHPWVSRRWPHKTKGPAESRPPRTQGPRPKAQGL